MKNSFFFNLSFSLFLILFTTTCMAQNEYNLTGGTGTPEMVNAGVRMRIDQSQVGVSVGTNLAYKNDNFNVSGEYYYHFGGRSGHTSFTSLVSQNRIDLYE